jgi:response regulator RpfG family c-di-GMP phosphodiesterase
VLDGSDPTLLIGGRAAAPGGHLPAMAVSAYAKGEDRTQAMAAGYEQFLAKPVEPVNLVRAVAILAGLGRPSAPDQSRTPPARRRGRGAASTPDTK